MHEAGSSDAMMDADALRFFIDPPRSGGVKVRAEKVSDIARSHLSALARITELEAELATRPETSVRGW